MRRNTVGALNKTTAQAHEVVEEVARAVEKNLIDKTSVYIAAHPLQSLALALAAGYLIGRLTR